MNKIRPSERLSRLLALTLSGLLYAGTGAAVLHRVQRVLTERPAIRIQAVRLNFAQMELQAVREPPPPAPEPPPPEKADMATEELLKEPAPEPVAADAQVAQEAAAPEMTPAEPDALLAWVLEQIEKEKYYPVSAQRAGYEGAFSLRIRVGANGVISGADVLGGRGHPLLRRSLEKVAGSLIGRSYGQPLPGPVELPFDYQFKLN